jgi:hypothetical protein
MKSSGKIYAPVTPFERQTSHCPLYIAWLVLDEARDYFRTNWVPSPRARTRKAHLIRPADTFSPSDAEKADLMGEGLADKLAHRAEVVFAGNPFWQRKYMSGHGRDYLLMTMRHWLAAVLAKERPALFRDLPESFKVGEPLPTQPLSRPKKIRKRNPPAQPFKHFVHGCELLAV